MLQLRPPVRRPFPYATAILASVVPVTPSTAICSGLPVPRLNRAGLDGQTQRAD